MLSLCEVCAESLSGNRLCFACALLVMDRFASRPMPQHCLTMPHRRVFREFCKFLVASATTDEQNARLIN